MKILKFATIMIAVVSLAGCFFNSAFAQENANQIEKQKQYQEELFLAAGFNRVDGIREFFAGKKRIEIEELKFHPDLKVSIVAAWISCKMDCRLLADQTDIQAERIKTSFLGFMSGRINSPIPSWWKRQIVAQDVFDKSISSVSPLKTDPFSLSGEIMHLDELKLIGASGKKIDGTQNDQKFQIEWDKSDYWGDGVFALHEELTGFAISPTPSDGRVFAISDYINVIIRCENRDQKTLWTKKVNTQGQSPVFGRIDETSYLEIKISNGNVILFGGNGNAIFASIFNLSTGERIAEFTTNYRLKDQAKVEEKHEEKNKKEIDKATGKKQR